MDIFHLDFASVATSAFLLITLLIINRLRTSPIPQVPKKRDRLDLISNQPEPSLLTKTLASSLPDDVIFSCDEALLRKLMNSYWAQQEREIVPACVVQPHNVHQLSTVVTILKREGCERIIQGGNKKTGGFAVRSGGHSPVPGAASIEGGILIDLSRFCEVAISEDKTSVVIGTGAK